MNYNIESIWNESASAALEALEQVVQPYLFLGWQPLGAPSLVFTPCDQGRFNGNDGFTAFQALTLEGDLRLPSDAA